MSSILGGQQRCGFGWHMFVECLAEGRGVSLPAGAVGAAPVTAGVGAYARIRKQVGAARPVAPPPPRRRRRRPTAAAAAAPPPPPHAPLPSPLALARPLPPPHAPLTASPSPPPRSSACRSPSLAASRRRSPARARGVHRPRRRRAHERDRRQPRGADGAVVDHETELHRARPPRRAGRDGHPRRRGICMGRTTSSARRTWRCRWRSPSRAPTS